MPFVKFIQYDGANAAQFRIGNQAAREDAFRQETQARAGETAFSVTPSRCAIARLLSP